LEGHRRPAALAQRRLRRAVDRIRELVVELAQQRVARGVEDRGVEVAVGHHALAALGDRGLHRLERLGHRRKVVVGPAACREPRRLRLDRLADLPDHRVIGVAVEDLEREARDEVGRHAQQVDAVAVADLDHHGHAQRGQRLAHRRAADAEPLADLALRHQPISGLELLDVDELPQPLDHSS
jgi:hypothetical protein